tara:strand:- start:287 stop:1450 length:1164 start_codon:yes stop_codon:yes gene_type:complete
MQSSNHICISAGGTGGHIFPAVALAERMLKFGWDVNFVTDERGEVFLDPLSKGISIKVIQVKQIKNFNILSWYRFLLKMFLSVLSFYISFRYKKPNVVVGFGGYSSLPICLSAIVSRVPLVLHEQNSVVGRVNKFFLNKSKCMAFGFPPLIDRQDILKIEDQSFNDLATAIREMEKKKPILVYLGNPVRAEILSRKNSIYTPPGDWPLTIFIVGGSQSADIFGHIVPKSLLKLSEKLRFRLRVYFQARKELKEMVMSELQKAGVRFEVSEFFDDISEKIANSQLIISRAGASTLSEIAIIGRPSILVPLPTAKDDHQNKNALAMEAAGASIVIRQEDFSPDNLSKELENFFSSPSQAEDMAAGALNFSKPRASENFGLLLNQMYRAE